MTASTKTIRERVAVSLRSLWRHASDRLRVKPEAVSSALASPGPEVREADQGIVVEVEILRRFLRRALEDHAIADAVDDVVFEHIVAGCPHRSVVAASLRGYVDELLNAATAEDWQAVADELISEGREVDGEG